MTETVYALRKDGDVVGIFSRDQPGMGLEPVDNDNPDVIAYREAAAAARDYYVISKMTPWLRMTDAEAETMTAAMDATPARLRAIYDAAPYLQSNDPLWPTLQGMLANCLSAQRAAELLAPEA